MDNKFLIKNKENIEKLNQFIDDNKDNISRMITSPELFSSLKELPDTELTVHDNTIKYKNKFVMMDVYFPAKSINFIFKDKRIDFDLPCICGYYSDESHLHHQELK